MEITLKKLGNKLWRKFDKALKELWRIFEKLWKNVERTLKELWKNLRNLKELEPWQSVLTFAHNFIYLYKRTLKELNRNLKDL